MYTAEQCGRVGSFAHAQILYEAGDDVVDFFIHHILLGFKRKHCSSAAVFGGAVETKPDKPGTHADPASRSRLASAVRHGVSPRHRGQLIDRSDNHDR